MTQDHALLTFEEAVAVCASELCPSGSITARTLRTERDKGRLRVHKIGRRIYTTRAALRNMIALNQCPDAPKDPGSTSGPPAAPAKPPTSSETASVRSAQAAAEAALLRLKEPSPTTSHRNTRRLRVITPASTTS